jgi:predicted small lipoprotein YifL
MLNKVPMQTMIMISLLIALAGCGVKGKPLPPLEPPPIGTGHPVPATKKEDRKNNSKR